MLAQHMRNQRPGLLTTGMHLELQQGPLANLSLRQQLLVTSQKPCDRITEATTRCSSESKATCYHETLESQISCGRDVYFFTPAAKKVLLLSSPVHGGYAELAACTEEIQRSPQLLRSALFSAQHSTTQYSSAQQSTVQHSMQGTARHCQQSISDCIGQA